VDYSKDSTWIAWNQAALLRLWGQDNAAEVVQVSKVVVQPPVPCLGGEFGPLKVAPNWKPFIPPLKAPIILQRKAGKTPEVPDSPLYNEDMGEPIAPLKAPIPKWKAWKTPKVPDSPSYNDDLGEPFDIDTMMDNHNVTMYFETPIWEVNQMVSVVLNCKCYLSKQ
jgi:hypothetical protein